MAYVVIPLFFLSLCSKKRAEKGEEEEVVKETKKIPV